MWCNKCGKIILADSEYCEECYAIISASLSYSEENGGKDILDSEENDEAEADSGEKTSSQKKLTKAESWGKTRKNKLIKWLSITAIALIGIVLLILKLSEEDPVNKLLTSTIRTISAGADFTYKTNGTKTSGFYKVDIRDKNIEAYAEFSIYEFAFLLEGSRLNYYYSYPNLMSSDSMNSERTNTTGRTDCGVDEDALYEFLDDASDKNFDELDFEYYIRGLKLLDEDEIEEYIDPEKINDAASEIIEALSKNAEECLGYYEEDGCNYFDIDIYETLEVCLEAVEKYLVDKDAYERLVGELEAHETELKSIPNIKMEIEYYKGYISEIEIKYDKVQYIISFENIGKCEQELDEEIIGAIRNM